MNLVARSLIWCAPILVAGQPTRTMPVSQPLNGLPQYGVAVTGTPNAPIIVNNSSRRIIGYVLRFEDANTHHFVVHRRLGFLGLRDGHTVGILPGASSTFSTHVQARFPGQINPDFYTSVTLDAVLFADGEFVGPDKSDAFDEIIARINGERDVHKLVLAAQNGTAQEKDSMWSQLILLSGSEPKSADTPALEMYQREQGRAATEILAVRTRSGDEAAYALAARTSVYPTIRRAQ